MNALVQDRGELLRRVSRRKIRPAHIAHEESVSGEDRWRADPARRDPSSECKCFRACVQEFAGTGGSTVTELNLVSVLDRNVRKLSAGSRAEIDAALQCVPQVRDVPTRSRHGRESR